jgi:hypothetical protein
VHRSCAGAGHFLFSLYSRGEPIDPLEPEAGAYDQSGYYPIGYLGAGERDGYPEIVADAEALTLTQVAEACRRWLKAHELPADGPLAVVNGLDEFTFPVPGALPVVTHLKEVYSAEEVFEHRVTEYPKTCPACSVQIISHEPHLARCPWCGATIDGEGSP